MCTLHAPARRKGARAVDLELARDIGLYQCVRIEIRTLVCHLSVGVADESDAVHVGV